jgi:hypothetical protein
MTARLASRKYDRDAVSEIVLEEMQNGLSTFKACQKAGVPHNTFIRWVGENKELADKYARAREDLIERMAQEIMEIADSPVPTTDSGATDSGAVQDKRVRIDTRKWLLSKLAPKKYGDKLELSGDANNPITIAKIERVVVDGQAKRIEDE